LFDENIVEKRCKTRILLRRAIVSHAKFTRARPQKNIAGDSKFVERVAQFCFPDALSEEIIKQPEVKIACLASAGAVLICVCTFWFKCAFVVLTRARAVQTYSFVVTDTDGQQRWGYCERVLLNGDKQPPTCFCILVSVASVIDANCV
jgi:hypothetical protein